MTRTIEVTVSPTGETKLETNGFSGELCRDASKFLENALGDKTAEQLTADFYRTATSETVRARPSP